MVFDYYKASDEFLGWAFVSLMAGQSSDQKKFEDLQNKTNGWKEIDLKVSINGVEVPTDYFMESIEKNMKWWAQKKAAETVESVLDGVREEVDKVGDILRETSDFVKVKLENELGFKFPED